MNEIQIALHPFTPADFPRLKSWIQDEIQLFQFAGPLLTYPITDAQLHSYVAMHNKKPFKVVLAETNEVVGHCELNFEEAEPVLSRILIGDETLRGKGIGEAVVIAMAKAFFTDAKINAVYLYVFEWNKAAIACYQKVGFEVCAHLTTYLSVGDQKWTRLKMRLNRDQFEQQKH